MAGRKKQNIRSKRAPLPEHEGYIPGIGSYHLVYYIDYQARIRVSFCGDYFEIKADSRIPVSDIEKFLLSKKALFARWQAKIDDKEVLTLPENSKSKSFKAALTERCLNLIENSNYDGPRPDVIKICNSKTYWGRCTTEKEVSISSYCSYLPDDLLFYILMHEFAHLTHMHHKSSFWNLVGLYCPYYEDAKRRLKRYSLK